MNPGNWKYCQDAVAWLIQVAQNAFGCRNDFIHERFTFNNAEHRAVKHLFVLTV